VLQAQAHFVNKMETNPDRFMRRECAPMLRHAAARLANFLRADPEDVVFVTNATTAMKCCVSTSHVRTGRRPSSVTAGWMNVLTCLV